MQDINVSLKNDNTYTIMAKSRFLDRWLDKVVMASGSEFVYFLIILGLLVWAFLGILFGTPNTWQVIISDV